jgi:putative ABC transport system permease protein
MNIATARATRRGKEVGVRKVFGGRKDQLITQFLGESSIYIVVSFLVGLVVAELSFVLFFNDIIKKSLSVIDVLNSETVLIAIGFIILISIASGIYPSVYLSNVNPLGVMKGKLVTAGGSAWVRKGLVSFQFFISCLLISATFVVMKQVDYLRNKSLGFNKEHVVTVRLSDRYSQKNYEILKQSLLQESNVSAVALSSTLPGSGNFHGFDIVPEGTDPSSPVSIKTLGVDEDFVSAYQLELVSGRNFSHDIQTDQRGAFILNESAAKKLNWREPLEKKLDLIVYTDGPVKYEGKVIGLVKDFHFQSLHSSIEPLLLYINKHPYYADYLSVSFKNSDVVSSVDILLEKWKAFNPEKPIDFQFLDDELANLYSTEMKVSKIFNLLALISIVIACLGLFGLSTYVAERRTKEVGIRKILGATTLQVFNLQVREFIILVAIANVAVLPLSWWWADNWLEGFAYHVSISPLVFLITFIGAVLLVVLTLTYHSMKVARANPVDTLRYE